MTWNAFPLKKILLERFDLWTLQGNNRKFETGAHPKMEASLGPPARGKRHTTFGACNLRGKLEQR